MNASAPAASRGQTLGICPCDGDKPITELLAPIRQKRNLPALAGAIVTTQGLVMAGAVGVRKTGTEIPVTVNDLWHLGSDTKAMTSVVIAKLVEDGKLKWDTTMEEIFPDLAPSLGEDFRKVTVTQLLCHRAGLPSNLKWRDLPKEEDMRKQRLAAVKVAGAAKLLSTPGSKFAYANLGYVIAGAIAERVAGDSWENLIRKIVFDPLGMATAGFGGTGTPGQIDQPWPHGPKGNPTPRNGPNVDNPPVMGPAGRVHCSLADWAKFVADQLRGDQGLPALLKPETYKYLHTPPFGPGYAFGWIVAQRKWAAGAALTHAGSNTMNYAVAWLAPKRGFAVLVCSNQGGGDVPKFCDQAVAALIGLYNKQSDILPRSLSAG